jgi:hypothetical protein
MTEEEGDLFITTVWAEYQKLHGHEREMSNIEWCLARHWRETGVPLRIVLRGMKDAGKTGRSLTWYEQPVEQAMAHWERTMNS